MVLTNLAKRASEASPKWTTNQPIAITHPEISRSLVTISEAVSLVLQDFAIGRNGDVLVLDMGEPVRVADLAKTLVRLSGKSRPEFKFIGLGPGEKLFEEVFYPDERVLASACEKTACTESIKLAWPALKNGLDDSMSPCRSASEPRSSPSSKSFRNLATPVAISLGAWSEWCATCMKFHSECP